MDSTVIKKKLASEEGGKSKIIRAVDAEQIIEVQDGISNVSKAMFFHSVQQPVKV